MHADPDELPWSVYRMLTGAVIPRPIAWVSTQSESGVDNLAPFSFFTIVSISPPIIAFAPMDRPESSEPKDTLRNVTETDEFVVNAVTSDVVEQMNETSGAYDPTEDEFEIANVTRQPSRRVAPHCVREAAVSLECQGYDMFRLETSTLVLGRVVHAHVDDRTVNDNGKFDVEQVDAIGRLAGGRYCSTADRFELDRPE